MVNILFSARDGLWDDYRGPLTQALAEVGVNADLRTSGFAPGEVDYIVFAPNGPVADFTPYTRTRAVLGLWAGVEDIVHNQTLTQPLAQMVDPGLATGMAEWVSGHILRYHLGLDADILNTGSEWAPRVPSLARERTVGFLGLGALGSACAAMLVGLGFQVAAWSRRPRKMDGIATYSGDKGLRSVLGRADFLVLLLPLTRRTECVINARTLARIKPGAVLLNPGRGGLIDEGALLAALDSGRVSRATLDVFGTEPLPADHRFWTHPNVTVTPHIASATRPETAARVISENVRRGEAGLPFVNLVDREQGY